MTVSVAPLHASQPFGESEAVRIAHLTPDITENTTNHIDAEVILLWPYSSSTRRFSLLLAEHDVRLRKSKGQVKVIFHNGCAKEVASLQVGIGDTVRLALDGVVWKETGDAVSTPGRKVEWDLEYRQQVVLEAARDGNPPKAISYLASPKSHIDLSNPGFLTPKVNGFVDLSSEISVPLLSSTLKPNGRLSINSSIGNLLDPFSRQDAEADDGGPRKRTKFARHSGGWTLANDDLPLESQEFITNIDVFDPYEVGTEDVSVSSGTTPLTAQLHGNVVTPSRRPADEFDRAAFDSVASQSDQEAMGDANEEEANEGMELIPPPGTTPGTISISSSSSDDLGTRKSEKQSGMITPRLLPLASPELPLVSPFIHRQNLGTEHSANREQAISDLDAISPAVIPQTEMPQRSLDSQEIDSTSSDDSVMLVPEDRASGAPNVPIGMQHDLLAVGIDFREDGDQTGMRGDDLSPLSLSPEIETPSRVDAVNFRPDFKRSLAPLPIAKSPHPEPVEKEDEDMYGGHQNRVLPNIEAGNEEQSANRSPNVLDILEQFLETSSISPGDHIGESQFINAHATSGPVNPPSFEPFSSNVSPEKEDGENFMGSASDQFSSALAPTGQRRLTGGSPVPFKEPTASQDHFIDGTIEDLREASDPRKPRNSSIPKTQDDSSLNEPLQNIGQQEHETDERSPVNSYSDEFRKKGLGATALEEVIENLTESVTQESTSIDLIPKSEVHSHRSKKGAAEMLTPVPTQEDPASPDAKFSFEPLRPNPTLPPTPRQTQEEACISVVRQEGTVEKTNEPDNAMVDGEIEVSMEKPPANTRRKSQRLLRKSISALPGESPYFTPHRANHTRQKAFTTEEAKVRPSEPEDLELESPSMIKSPKSFVKSLLPTLKTSAEPSTEKGSKDHIEIQQRYPSRKIKSSEVSLALGISTDLSYYPHLGSLHEHFAKVVDIIAVCSQSMELPQKAPKGPKDYNVSVQLVDISSSIAGSPETTTQFFRHLKNALPTAQRGDVIMLRDVKVQAWNKSLKLISTDTSAWAVFKAPAQFTAKSPEVAISGPPLEYSSQEVAYVMSLLNWWEKEGGVQYPAAKSIIDGGQKQQQKPSDGPRLQSASSSDKKHLSNSKPSAKNRRRANMTDNDANEGDDRDESAFDTNEPDQNISLTSQPQPNQRRPTRSSSVEASQVTSQPVSTLRTRPHQREQSVVHELRNGTKYVDTQDEQPEEKLVHELRGGVKYVDK